MSDIPDTKPNPAVTTSKKLSVWIPILGFILLLALGIFSGVQSGYSQRRAAQSTVVGLQVDEQYRLGMEAMKNGQYEIAYQHFDFVAKNSPNYPGLLDALNQLALWTMMSPTPIPSLTPTLTPTPDLRGAEAIFNQAKQQIAAKDWTNALNSLDALRKAEPTYRAVEVDGMYYIALRSRGMAKIFPESCVDTNLEGGIYDLTLAERFGPLDRDATATRDFARYYMAGAAFWEVDWLKAQNYFSQAMLGPNLMDSSCQTARERWYDATIEYAKILLAMGDNCNAELQLEAAFSLQGDDQLAPTATEAYYLCYGYPVTAIPPTAPTSSGETATPTETPPTP